MKFVFHLDSTFEINTDYLFHLVLTSGRQMGCNHPLVLHKWN